MTAHRCISCGNPTENAKETCQACYRNAAASVDSIAEPARMSRAGYDRLAKDLGHAPSDADLASRYSEALLRAVDAEQYWRERYEDARLDCRVLGAILFVVLVTVIVYGIVRWVA